MRRSSRLSVAKPVNQNDKGKAYFQLFKIYTETIVSSGRMPAQQAYANKFYCEEFHDASRLASEVWQVLSAVKEEFSKFGPVLEKVVKKLQEASNQIDNVEVRGRAINRKLRNVEILPANDGQVLIETLEDDLGFDDGDVEADGKMSA